MIEVYFDGACEPVNPGGVATYGFVIYRDGAKLHEGCGVVGCGALGDDVSNNVAEYTALIKALEWLLDNGFAGEDVVVKGDSQLAIRQVNGYYSVRAPRIIPLYRRVMALKSRFRNIRFTWVPREMNAEADDLSKKAYVDFCRRNRDLILSHYSRYLATEKQLRYIRFLGGKPREFMSRREASKAIDRLLRSRG